jgi:hypothetical protein
MSAESVLLSKTRQRQARADCARELALCNAGLRHDSTALSSVSQYVHRSYRLQPGWTRAVMLLWDVDTQVDFLFPGGRLYVPGAESILPSLARLTAYARERHCPLISSVCAHRPGDPELNIYGPRHGRNRRPAEGF